jgi:hypothetical protein
MITTHSVVQKEERATKRVALTPRTWADLSRLKEPGKILGDTVADLIAEHHPHTLEKNIEQIEKNGHYIPWDQAKKELGL